MSHDEDEMNDLIGTDAVAEKTHRGKERSPLLQLMLDICPPDEKNAVSVSILAGRLGVTPQAIYNIVKKDRITYKRAISILELDEDGSYSLSDFSDYLI